MNLRNSQVWAYRLGKWISVLVSYQLVAMIWKSSQPNKSNCKKSKSGANFVEIFFLFFLMKRRGRKFLIINFISFHFQNRFTFEIRKNDSLIFFTKIHLILDWQNGPKYNHELSHEKAFQITQQQLVSNPVKIFLEQDTNLLVWLKPQHRKTNWKVNFLDALSLSNYTKIPIIWSEVGELIADEMPNEIHKCSISGMIPSDTMYESSMISISDV